MRRSSGSVWGIDAPPADHFRHLTLWVRTVKFVSVLRFSPTMRSRMRSLKTPTIVTQPNQTGGPYSSQIVVNLLWRSLKTSPYLQTNGSVRLNTARWPCTTQHVYESISAFSQKILSVVALAFSFERNWPMTNDSDWWFWDVADPWIILALWLCSNDWKTPIDAYSHKLPSSNRCKRYCINLFAQLILKPTEEEDAQTIETITLRKSCSEHNTTLQYNPITFYSFHIFIIYIKNIHAVLVHPQCVRTLLVASSTRWWHRTAFWALVVSKISAFGAGQLLLPHSQFLCVFFAFLVVWEQRRVAFSDLNVILHVL